MKFGTELHKRMIEMDIKGFKELSDKVGLSYPRTIRVMHSDSSCKLVDVVAVASYLGLKLNFTADTSE